MWRLNCLITKISWKRVEIICDPKDGTPCFERKEYNATVGRGEYGTAGVKTAPLYLSNGSPERDKFILKVDLKIQ